MICDGLREVQAYFAHSAETIRGKWCCAKKSNLMADKVIFYDGDCNLCDWSVGLAMTRDSLQQFRFLSLQSCEAKESLMKAGFILADVDSVIYLDNDKIFFKSEALLRILSQLGGIFKLADVLRVLPERLLDMIYDLISKNRYNWFGTKSNCAIKLNRSNHLKIR
jgi:predicted DCC family thiol-disulfide oxidoreductase YuxK